MKKTLKFTKLLLGATLSASVLLSGCGNSENFVFTNTGNLPIVVPTPAPPVAVNDSYSALGNATVNFGAAGGVLANDTLNGAVISGFDAVGTQGGAMTLNADGSLSYTPVFGFVGVETFTYTLTNDDGNSTATVTFTSTGAGFFVNNQAAANGDGSQASPFDNLAAALAAAGSGDTIYVFRGDGTPYAGGFSLADGVNLIGEGNGLVAAQQIEPSGQAPEIGGITLMGNNTVSGFRFTGNTDAITASGVSNLTITNNTFQTADSEQVGLANIGGTLTISNNTFETQDDDYGIYLDYVSSNGAFTITDNIFRLLASGDGDSDDAVYVFANGTSMVTGTVSGNTVTGSGNSDPGSNIEYGIYVTTLQTANLNLTLADNSVTGVADEGIYIQAFNQSPTLTLTGTDNMVSNLPDTTGFVLFAGDEATVNASLSGYTATSIGDSSDDHGLFLDVNDNASVTATISNSTFSAIDGSGLVADNEANAGGETSSLTLFLNGNSFSNIAQDSANINARASNGGSPTTCADISGNTFDGANLELFADGADLDVVQLNTLTSTNNFIAPAAPATSTANGGTVTQGACTTP